MARALWSGSLSFGLVNVPVQLFSAVRDLDLHFNQLHEKDGSPIETRRFCAEEDREVPFEVIGRGYELDNGDQVVLTDEELATAAPRKTRTIDIEAFVDLADVDPIYFDHPYFLLPAGEGEGSKRAYQLLLKVMQRTDRAALGRFVMRTKEYLVIVRVRDDRLALTTMLFHDEIRPAKGIPTGGKKPKKAQLDDAVALIEALAVDWDPSQYEDRYRERLLEVVKRKKKGKRITVPDDERPALTGARPDGRARGEPEGGQRGRRQRVRRRRRPRRASAASELYERAQDADVPGRSSMSKDELVDALDAT